MNYSELDQELRDLVSKHYPGGFKKELMTVPKSDGTSYKAFTMDTGDALYLIKVEDRFLKSAEELLEEAEDFIPDETDFDA